MTASGRALPPDDRRWHLVVGQDARATRHALDPTAWMLLEELALSGEEDLDSERMVATTSVRDLAACVGLSKDTVAAALRRLATAGLVVRQEERDGPSGRFGRTRYVVDLVSTGLCLGPCRVPGATPPDTVTLQPAHSNMAPIGPTGGAFAPARARRRLSRSSAPEQLVLLDPDPSLA